MPENALLHHALAMMARTGALDLQLLAEAGSVDVSVFAQYGVLGIFAFMLVVFARGAHQRERERADRMAEENKRLNELILERVIPALSSATRAAEESGELLNALQRERELMHLAERKPTRGGGG